MPVLNHLGKSLHYVLEDNAFPEDVLFIHGNLASARWWEPTMALLHQSKSPTMHGRLVAMDWPGCGTSSAPESENDLQMSSLAADHVALIRALGLSNVHVVGHSTGGLIALIAMWIAPDLFSKALLLDPVSAEGIQFEPEMLKAFDQMRSDRDFCESVMAGTVHGVNTKDPFIQKLFDDAFGVHDLIWHGVLNALKEVDVRKEVRSIQQPTLVLHGELDQVLPEDGSKQISELLPHGQFEQLKGRGHSTNVEDPRMFVEKLSRFFSSNM